VSTAVVSTAVVSTLVVSTAVESTVVVVASTVSVFLQDVKEIAAIAITANNTFFIIFRFLIFLHDYIS
jgi:diacylglycerol kinase